MSQSNMVNLEHVEYHNILATVTKEALEFNKPCSKHNISIDFCVQIQHSQVLIVLSNRKL